MDTQYWVLHLRMGVALGLVMGLLALGWSAAAADVAHPSRLRTAAMVGLLVTGGAALMPARWLVTRRWFPGFLAACSATAITLIAVGALADRAGASLLLWLLVIPVVYAGVTYPPPVAGTIGLVASATAAGFGLVEGGGPHNVVQSAVLLALTGTLLLSSRERWQALSTSQTLAAQLNDLARVDGLTGCLGTRAFWEEVDQTLGTADDAALALLLVDVDRFKRINDTLGHPLGDTVLREIGRILQDQAREDDLVARLGGDEFAVALPGATMAAARTVGGRVGAVVEELGLATVSVGITTRGPGEGHRELYARADAALYAAKEAGRNRVRTLPPR